MSVYIVQDLDLGVIVRVLGADAYDAAYRYACAAIGRERDAFALTVQRRGASARPMRLDIDLASLRAP